MRPASFVSLSTVCAAAVLSFSLGGCAPWDATNGLVKSAAQVRGVIPVTTHSPYMVVSFSKLLPYVEHSERPVVEGFRPIAAGSYESWNWRVRVLEDTEAKSMVEQGGNTSDHQDTNVCSVFDWSSAFEESYRLASYLLGKPPLPLSMDIDLIPYGMAYRSYKPYLSGSKVPLEFVFWNPVTLHTNSCPERHQAYVDIVATAMYEFQHLEYATGTSGAQVTGMLGNLVNEATSTCWSISEQLVLSGGNARPIPIRSNDVGFGIYNLGVYGLLFGTGAQRQNAVPWGPLLLKYDLVRYLKGVSGSVEESGEYAIDSSNRKLVNAVLAYCRGFTGYKGDFVIAAMPDGQVSRVFFFDSPTPPR